MTQDQDAERSVVGALLIGASPADVAAVFGELRPEAFTRPELQTMFGGLGELYEAGSRVDEVSLLNLLRERGASVTASQIAAVSHETPEAVNLPHWARLVRQHWQRRRLIAVATAAQRLAASPGESITDVIDQIAEMVSGITIDGPRANVKTMRELVREEFKEIERASASGETETGIATGLQPVDDVLGGLQRQDLIIVAGRPSMGKTSLAMGWAKHAATVLGKRVLVISLEMGNRALARRMISEHSGIESPRLRHPKLMRDTDWPRLASCMQTLSVDNLEIADQRRVTIHDIRAHGRIAKARGGLDLLVVDYLQLVKPAERGHSREREVAEISDGLKSLALELAVPVVLLSQLNRENEKRGDKRPMLSDLRDSGAIEQDADVVVFVHQPHKYNMKEPEDEAEIIIAKQRNGDTGLVRVGWDGPRTRFYDKVRR